MASFLINWILRLLLGEATSLANSDRVKVGLMTAIGAALNAIGLPIAITKINAVCGSCVQPDFIQHITELITGGILAKGAVLIHSIGQRDVLTPAQEYDAKVKGLTPEQITALVAKGMLPAQRPADPPQAATGKPANAS